MNPLGYNVILKDNNGVVVDYIQNKIKKLSWDWNRIGGCGACRMSVGEEWDAALASSFAEDYEINIYLPTINGTSALWYSGFIDKVSPFIKGDVGAVDVSCLGYVNQLKRMIIEKKTYIGQEISNVVKNLAEVYGTGDTSITTTASDFEDTKFTADRLYFDESLYAAIVKCAEIAGRREWGVRADKSLFFLARDDSIKTYYNLTEDFTSFRPQRDYNPMITEIFLRGGSGYEAIFKITNRITVRKIIVSNSAITTQSVGQQFGRMFLKENGIPRRAFTASMVKKNTRIEETIPIAKVAINVKIGIKSLYDVATNLYDSGLKYDGGTEALQINKIKYTLMDDGVDIALFLGPLSANIIDDLGKLEYMIETERIIT